MGATTKGGVEARPAEHRPPDSVEIEIAEIGDLRLAIVSWPLLGASDASARANLSPADESILRGIARGLSNAEIADERGTSARTVANQVASLLRKFGVASRYELIAVVASNRAPRDDESTL